MIFPIFSWKMANLEFFRIFLSTVKAFYFCVKKCISFRAHLIFVPDLEKCTTESSYLETILGSLFFTISSNALWWWKIVEKVLAPLILIKIKELSKTAPPSKCISFSMIKWNSKWIFMPKTLFWKTLLNQHWCHSVSKFHFCPKITNFWKAWKMVNFEICVKIDYFKR